MKAKKTLLLAAIMVLSVSQGFIKAQVLRINPKESSITILGKSNLHDWESKASQINGQLEINTSAKQVQSMTVEIPVKSIKSGEKMMDSKTYEAFKADKNPSILFKLTDVSSLQINPNDINVIFTGNLTLAGVTKKISMKATGKPNKAGTFIFNSNVALKMTDFKIAPPTAMMGMLKVGDDITLKFNIAIDGVNLSYL